MMMNEFEERTGFFPTLDLYSAIEEAYMDSGLDKDSFCKAYKKNVNGMANAIARKVSLARIVGTQEAERETNETISKLEKAVKQLKEELDREQEWIPFESDRNVKQADYTQLAKYGHYMTDEEAKDWVCNEFGFERSKVIILHEIDEEEINRHRQCRRTGNKIDRRPVYDATDYNYIRFNVSNWYYEAWQGQLQQFYC